LVTIINRDNAKAKSSYIVELEAALKAFEAALANNYKGLNEKANNQLDIARCNIYESEQKASDLLGQLGAPYSGQRNNPSTITVK
jgi:hypothetical protein